MFKYVYLIIIIILFGLTNCNEQSPVKSSNNPLSLSLLDVSSTEIYIKISLNESEPNRVVVLKRGQKLIASINLKNNDTIFIDEHLLPNQSYSYTVTTESWSQHLLTTTLDSTSHEILWQLYTLGDGNSSYLSDVAIINDTLAYAVGEIYLKDSTGKWDSNIYNVAKWNGEKWELERVSVNFRGNIITLPIESIFAFSSTDIWLIGSLPIHGDGQNWELFDLRSKIGFENISISRAWGSSSKSMYFVGGAGSIVHFDGKNWQKIDAGNLLDLHDIYGSTDDKTGQEKIVIVGGQEYPPQKTLIQIQDGIVSSLSMMPIQYEAFGVWFIPNRHYYLVGDGIYEKRSLGESMWENKSLDITIYSTEKVKGLGLNDIFVTGSYGELLHYNGMNWRSYRNQTALSQGAFGGISLKRNLVMVAGSEQIGGISKGVVAIGKRSGY